MQTITDAVGSAPIHISALCDEKGYPTEWKVRGPTKPNNDEKLLGVDGLHEDTEDTEPNPRGSLKPLGGLVSMYGDKSPPPATNDNKISGKKGGEWKAMERAKAGTLMLTAMENLAAEVILLRVSELYGASDLSMSAIPSPWTDHFRSSRHDHSAVDLKGESDDTESDGFGGYQTDMYIKCGPSPEALVKMGAEEFIRQIKKHPWLFRDRLVGVRGPYDERPAKVRDLDFLTLEGKVHGKGGPPPHDPEFAPMPALTRAVALDEIELLWTLVSPELFEVLVEISYFKATASEIGQQAGFSHKQAESVGLDRCRLAMLAGVRAFQTIDRMGKTTDCWWRAIPDSAVVPANTFKRLAEAHSDHLHPV